MKMFHIMFAAFLSPMVLFAADSSDDAKARQEYINEKTALLSEIYMLQKKAYDTGMDGNLAKVRQAHELLMKFKRDNASDRNEKIQCQKALIEALQKDCRSVEENYKAGTEHVINVFKARLALIDAREDLRKLEQGEKQESGVPVGNKD